MQLVYFWIEEYGILKEQGVNFNSGFHFEIKKYNDTYILERKQEKEKKIPKYFFSNIENISCIIGENGGGKTTLIKSILNQKSNKNLIGNYLSIFEENNQFFIHSNLTNLKVNFSYKKLEELEKDINYIYFNTEWYGPTLKNNSILNISLKRVSDREFLKQKMELVNTLVINKDIIDRIPYINFKNKLNDIVQSKNFLIKVKEEDMLGKLNLNYQNNFFAIGQVEKNFLECLIYEFWNRICWCISDNEKFKVSKRNKEEIKIWFLQKILELEDRLNKEDFILRIKKEDMIKEIQRMRDLIKIFEDYKQNSLIEEKTSKSILINLDLLKKYKKILNNRFLECSLEHEFSSGEKILLDLMSRLLTKTKNLKEKNIIIFLEELENFMHPEWQRRIIEFLIFLKNNIFWMKEKNIQIILTSHTPFIIGDLPEKNVIFIKDGNIIPNIKKVFGGNIYNLLKEQFLMESCFGEFSKEKIKKIVELLSRDEKNNYKEIEIEKAKEEIEFLIDSIGEDLVKNRLEKMYDDYKSSKIKDKTYNDLEFEKYLKERGITKKDIIKILEEKRNDKNSNI